MPFLLNSRSHRFRSRLIAALVTSIALFAVLISRLSALDARDRTVVLAVDRTESVSGTSSWPIEAAEIARATVINARADGATRLVVIGIGSVMADTSKAADVDLDLSCSNPRRCEEDLQRIGDQVAVIVQRLAATPPTRSGTDVLAALISARDLCASTPCGIVVASDLEDSRLTDTRSAEALAASLAPSLPSFEGIPVTLVGIGADGAPTAAVSRATSFFRLLLTAVGSPPTITRNI